MVGMEIQIHIFVLYVFLIAQHFVQVNHWLTLRVINCNAVHHNVRDGFSSLIYDKQNYHIVLIVTNFHIGTQTLDT